MLGQFKVIASDDFKTNKKGNPQFVYKGKDGAKSAIYLSIPWKLMRKKYLMGDIEIMEVASEESIQRAGGQAVWAISGAILTGGLGLLAGAVLGRKKDMVTFICKFTDGKKFVGVMKKNDFSKFSTACGNTMSLLDSI